eukprot:407422-Prorocentrum_minimum.AAC.1
MSDVGGISFNYSRRLSASPLGSAISGGQACFTTKTRCIWTSSTPTSPASRRCASGGTTRRGRGRWRRASPWCRTCRGPGKWAIARLGLYVCGLYRKCHVSYRNFASRNCTFVECEFARSVCDFTSAECEFTRSSSVSGRTTIDEKLQRSGLRMFGEAPLMSGDFDENKFRGVEGSDSEDEDEDEDEDGSEMEGSEGEEEEDDDDDDDEDSEEDEEEERPQKKVRTPKER